MILSQDSNCATPFKIKKSKVVTPSNSNNLTNSNIINHNQIPYPNFSKTTNNKKITRIKFTPNEDEELLNLVSIYGDNDWNKISEELAKKCLRKDCNGKNVIRTPRRCRDRYINYLSPEVSNSDWTPEEDHFLELQVLFHPHKWKHIKKNFPGRSEVALRNRFNFIHKNHFDIIKPLINDQINSNALFKRYSPNEIVQRAFNLQKHSMNSNETKTNILNTTNLNLDSFQRLYKKFNKDPAMDIIRNNPIPAISQDSVNHLYDAVKSEELQNKVDYMKQELLSLSKFVENKAFFEMLSHVPNILNDPGSDYDPFILDS